MKQIILVLGFYLTLVLSSLLLPQASAQEATPSANPATPSPTMQPPITPTPLPLATPNPTPSFPNIPQPTPAPTFEPIEIIIPEVIVIPLPSTTPEPSNTPRPILPIDFPLTTQPSPSSFSPISPFLISESEGNRRNSAFRTLVVPTLSFVTQTNADEFYKDQALPKHTADLLYLFSILAILAGVFLTFEQSIINNLKKLREKEFVQYLPR